MSNQFIMLFCVCVGFGVADVEPSFPTAFLASRVLPVDAYKIRNSLYLTVSRYFKLVSFVLFPSVVQQSMREPPQAAVNVIEQEDVDGMFDQAKYHGIADQLERSEAYINSRLAANNV